MRQAEWELLPKAVSLFCQGKIRLEGNRAVIDAEESGKNGEESVL